ncbi:MAG TPA: replication protein P [Burkholderiaceae bacterium]|jgi:hypothetical protein|nr:replication protein P [Burkholderiaceae bacterium]
MSVIADTKASDSIVATPSLTRPDSRWFDIHPKLGISTIDHLFNRLDGTYPHKWRSAYPTNKAINNWAESWVEAFEDEGISPEDVKRGLKVCRSRYDWPPSCAEFIKACKMIVEPLVGYYEAVEGVQARQRGEHGKWSHPAIYWAAMPLAFDLATQTYSHMRARWEQSLAEQMMRTEWLPIPAPMAALPAPGKAVLSKEKAAQLLHQLGVAAILRPRVEHTAWYREILERHQRGDPTLSAAQINCAKEAARNHAAKQRRQTKDEETA